MVVSVVLVVWLSIMFLIGCRPSPNATTITFSRWVFVVTVLLLMFWVAVRQPLPGKREEGEDRGEDTSRPS